MKKKRNRFWIVYIILIILTLPLAVSCPATPETLDSSDDKPYIAPAAPQNLAIQNGLQNKIVLSWDPVVDADLYIIEYSSADQPSEYKRIGETKNTSYEIVANSGNGSVKLDPNQSYFFTVKAITFFGTVSKESEMSDIIEGAMAPDELEVLIFPTNFDITVSWSSPNLLGYDGLPLYDATFELRYKKSDESDWKTISDPKTDNIWEEYSFGINEFNLVYNAYYDFEILMTINSESGPVSISSGVKTAKVSEDYSPSNIKDYDVSTDYPDKIVVSWIFPSWAKEELKDTSCFFIIERSLEGSEDWETLVDEISEKGVRDPNIHFDGAGDEPNTLKFSYDDFASDSKIVAGKKYIYRITNAVKQTEDVFYRANPDGLVSSYSDRIDRAGEKHCVSQCQDRKRIRQFSLVHFHHTVTLHHRDDAHFRSHRRQHLFDIFHTIYPSVIKLHSTAKLTVDSFLKSRTHYMSISMPIGEMS